MEDDLFLNEFKLLVDLRGVNDCLLYVRFVQHI